MSCCTLRTACSVWARKPSVTPSTGPDQRREDPGDRNPWRVVLSPRRLLRDDARRPPRPLCPGAFQVSQHGDLANWHTGSPDGIPAVGGAMDLAIGAKSVFVMMTLSAKDGTAKLVPECTYPLTGLRCVRRVYTDHAIFEIDPTGNVQVRVLETFRI